VSETRKSQAGGLGQPKQLALYLDTGITSVASAYHIHRERRDVLFMDIVFSRNSLHIYGKPSEILEVLSSLSETYATLGDLLASGGLDAGLHLQRKFPREDAGSPRGKKKLRVFLDSPPHCSDIDCVPLKSFEGGHSAFGDNNMPFV
jgi:hypothetical protein